MVNGVPTCICRTGYTGNICQTQTSELTVGMNKNIVEASCCEHPDGSITIGPEIKALILSTISVETKTE